MAFEYGWVVTHQNGLCQNCVERLMAGDSNESAIIWLRDCFILWLAYRFQPGRATCWRALWSRLLRCLPFWPSFITRWTLPSSSVCQITLLHRWESFLHRVPAFLDPFIQNTLDQARRNTILLEFWDAGEEGGWVGGWREAHCLTFYWHFWNSEIWSN